MKRHSVKYLIPRDRNPLVMVLTFVALSVLLAVGGYVATEASGGPVARQDPTCDDAPKVGIAYLNPGGTQSAMEQVVFDIPFCSSELAAFATVDNHNTGGEATGAKPWGVEAVNVSMKLDAPSKGVYTVYWRVEPITQ